MSPSTFMFPPTMPRWVGSTAENPRRRSSRCSSIRPAPPVSTDSMADNRDRQRYAGILAGNRRGRFRADRLGERRQLRGIGGCRGAADIAHRDHPGGAEYLTTNVVAVHGLEAGFGRGHRAVVIADLHHGCVVRLNPTCRATPALPAASMSSGCVRAGAAMTIASTPGSSSSSSASVSWPSGSPVSWPAGERPLASGRLQRPVVLPGCGGPGSCHGRRQ